MLETIIRILKIIIIKLENMQFYKTYSAPSV